MPGTDDYEGNNKDDNHYEPDGLIFLAARVRRISGPIATQPGHAIIVAERVRRDGLDGESCAEYLPGAQFAGDDDVHTTVRGAAFGGSVARKGTILGIA